MRSDSWVFCAKPAAVVNDVTMPLMSSPEPMPVEEMTVLAADGVDEIVELICPALSDYSIIGMPTQDLSKRRTKRRRAGDERVRTAAPSAMSAYACGGRSRRIISQTGS